MSILYPPNQKNSFHTHTPEEIGTFVLIDHEFKKVIYDV